jgi:hypothetical protein
MNLRNLFPILFASVLIGGSELAATASADYVYLECSGRTRGELDINNKKRHIDESYYVAIVLDEENSRLRYEQGFWQDASFNRYYIVLRDESKLRGGYTKKWFRLDRDTGNFVSELDRDIYGTKKNISTNGKCIQKGQPKLF